MNRNRLVFSPDHNSGSSTFDEPEFLVVGKLRRPHGLRGDILMSVLTDFPERLVAGMRLYVGDDHQPIDVSKVRWHRNDMLIAFDGYENREDAGVFRNQLVSVRMGDLPPLEEGEYYLHQLVGLRVIDNIADTLLGVVEKIIETGAPHDVFLVRAEDGSELLIPDIESVVKSINIQSCEMRVHLLPGLIPE